MSTEQLAVKAAPINGGGYDARGDKDVPCSITLPLLPSPRVGGHQQPSHDSSLVCICCCFCTLPACVVKARNPNHSSTTTAVRVKRVGSSTDRGLASPSVILHGDSFFLCSVLFRCPFLRPQKARGGGSHPTESLSYVKAFCRTVRAACLCLLATGALPLSLV